MPGQSPLIPPRVFCVTLLGRLRKEEDEEDRRDPIMARDERVG